jgi:hypothetical protein
VNKILSSEKNPKILKINLPSAAFECCVIKIIQSSRFGKDYPLNPLGKKYQ